MTDDDPKRLMEDYVDISPATPEELEEARKIDSKIGEIELTGIPQSLTDVMEITYARKKEIRDVLWKEHWAQSPVATGIIKVPKCMIPGVEYTDSMIEFYITHDIPDTVQ